VGLVLLTRSIVAVGDVFPISGDIDCYAPIGAASAIGVTSGKRDVRAVPPRTGVDGTVRKIGQIVIDAISPKNTAVDGNNLRGG